MNILALPYRGVPKRTCPVGLLSILSTHERWIVIQFVAQGYRLLTLRGVPKRTWMWAFHIFKAHPSLHTPCKALCQTMRCWAFCRCGVSSSIWIFITRLLPLACQAHWLHRVPALLCLIESFGFEAIHVAGHGIEHDVRGEFLAPQLAAEVLYATELGCISLKG